MEQPQDSTHGNGPEGPRDATTGTPPDDRREDPPLPGAEQVDDRSAPAPATESEREALETVRSISRLEESN